MKGKHKKAISCGEWLSRTESRLMMSQQSGGRGIINTWAAGAAWVGRPRGTEIDGVQY